MAKKDKIIKQEAKEFNDVVDLPVEVPNTGYLSSDNKFQVGDDVEVHGLPECREYFSYGKVTKVLDGYMYSIDGICSPVKKGLIGKNTKIVRTFHESNLRKVTVLNG